MRYINIYLLLLIIILFVCYKLLLLLLLSSSLSSSLLLLLGHATATRTTAPTTRKRKRRGSSFGARTAVESMQPAAARRTEGRSSRERTLVQTPHPPRARAAGSASEDPASNTCPRTYRGKQSRNIPPDGSGSGSPPGRIARRALTTSSLTRSCRRHHQGNRKLTSKRTNRVENTLRLPPIIIRWRTWSTKGTLSHGTMPTSSTKGTLSHGTMPTSSSTPQAQSGNKMQERG